MRSSRPLRRSLPRPLSAAATLLAAALTAGVLALVGGTAAVAAPAAAAGHPAATTSAGKAAGKAAGKNRTAALVASGPAMSVTVTTNTPRIPESGAIVRYVLTIRNTGDVPLTVTSVVTKGGRDLLAESTQSATTATYCTVSLVVAPGGTFTCAFKSQVPVTGEANGWHSQVVTVTATDGTTTLSDTQWASVRFTDVLPGIVTYLWVPSSTVTSGTQMRASVTIVGTSHEWATLDNVTVSGGELVKTSCATGTRIDYQTRYTCVVTYLITGNVGDAVTLTATATVHDNEGNVADATGTRVVTIV